ncbi:hypothetical protein Taro_007332 [Colocasia esculenta]|uniref:GPI mannosyltransferase 2 n=1 Tax=Colocasia esculenta TaxID=4460 RepID=A0A843TTT6_COLES|nr:hypothetical protein [Colocasia esculenta]
MWNSGVSRRVLRAAAFSRLLLLSLICLCRLLLHPYDTSAALNPPCLRVGGGENSPGRPEPWWPWLGAAIERSVVWDAVYFVRIAECGYEYEQSYAFFPALPVGISLLSRSAFAPLVPVIGYRAVLALSGYVLSNVMFLFAAVYFYKLSVLILKDATVAFHASILFCFNPASVFYSSIYSESLYALFSMGGLYHLFSGSNIIAMLLLSLSGSARSNGVLNAGYFCFQAMHQAYDAISRKLCFALAVKDVIAGVMQSIFVFGPFVAFQAYGYINICMGSTSDELRPWCKARVPQFSWNKYFQVKQLPNFVLAFPIISLAVCSVIDYVRLRPEVVFSLGFLASSEEKRIAALLYQSTKGKPDIVHTLDKNVSSKDTKGSLMCRQRKHEKKQRSVSSYDEVADQVVLSHAKEGYSSILVLPFIYHLAFMTMTAFFVMHVQVATRFLSASPPIYWFTAYLLDRLLFDRSTSPISAEVFTALLRIDSDAHTT